LKSERFCAILDNRENRVQKYKLAKKISNQIEYLENKKHVQFNIMSKK
jgi:hypothetical protein